MNHYRQQGGIFLVTLSVLLLHSFPCFPQLKKLPDEELINISENKLDYSKDFPQKSILLPQAPEELNLTIGKSGSPKMCLHNSTKHTYTVYGDTHYKAMLEHPTDDKTIIINRQNFIRHLTTSAQSMDELSTILSHIAHHQSNVLSLWSVLNPISGSTDALASFSQMFGCTESKIGIEAIRLVMHGGLWTLGLGSALLSLRSGYILIGNLQRHTNADIVTPGAISLASTLAFALWYYKGLPITKNVERINLDMQELMISVGTTIRAAQALYNCLEKEHTAHKALVHMKDLKEFIVTSKELEKDLEKLVKDLHKSTFQGTPHWRSYMGRVRVAYQLINKLKDSLIPVMKAIGEVDSYVSVAKLINEYADQPIRFSFTDFLNSNEPMIKLQQSWNPIIRTEKIIPEDIMLGAGEGCAPNILLTGPHGGGKSTIMRQVSYAIILSQVFGIAPCNSCTMTIFSSINTYLDIKDNMQAGMSTFMAERQRIDLIKKIIRGLQPNKFGFTVIDELFKGTMEAEASKLVTNFIQKIEQVTESICIMSSHFVQPAIEAEERDNSRFLNYHMDTEERTPGRFKRTFRLMKGRCDWWFNDPEKRDRYVKWLQTVIG